LAALKYQHATMDRDAALAEALSEHVQLPPTPARFEASGDIREMSSELPVSSGDRHGADEGKGRAGDGDRTRITSLEGWGSAIELRPRAKITLARRSAGPRSSEPARRRDLVRSRESQSLLSHSSA
jgi:hypothetical protein